MEISYDPAKNAVNIAKHGISLAEAIHLDLDTATVKLDSRKEYGEERFSATGFIGKRLHIMILTPRNDGLCIISLRKANLRESKKYAKETNRVY